MSNDHYVPQFLIRNFSFNEKGQVHVFDKTSEKIFTTTPRNICSENKYNFEEIEKTLSILEKDSSIVINKVVSNKNLSCLTQDDKLILQFFAAAQYCRSKHFRNSMKHIHDSRKKILAKLNNQEEIDDLETSDEFIKVFTSDFLIKEVPELATYLELKEWILFENTHSEPLYLSDNPLVMYNDEETGFYGNIGFGVKGIQIYLPITPKLLIAMCCKSNNDKIKEQFENSKRNREKMTASMTLSPHAQEFRSQHDEILNFLSSEEAKLEDRFNRIEQGLPIEFHYETLKLYNCLQVYYSTKLVISNEKSFSMAKDYLKFNPKAKEEHKPQIESGF